MREIIGQGEIEPWLNNMNRGTMLRAARLVSPVKPGTIQMDELLRVEAKWLIQPEYLECENVSPSHCTLRKRGIAPTYPRPHRFNAMTTGFLVLYPTGFVLEPLDTRHPCHNVSATSVKSSVFYRDALEVSADGKQRILISAKPIDRIDAIFQAYFWNPACGTYA